MDDSVSTKDVVTTPSFRPPALICHYAPVFLSQKNPELHLIHMGSSICVGQLFSLLRRHSNSIMILIRFERLQSYRRTTTAYTSP